MNKTIKYIPGKALTYIFFLFLLSNPILVSNGQYADISSIFDVSDTKKIEKADKMIQDADNITAEVNEINLEILSLQNNFELDEKTVQKKISKLEDKSVSKQFEAALNYQNANEIKYKIYSAYAKKFRESNDNDNTDYVNYVLIEEQASEFYNQAADKRKKLARIKDNTSKLASISEIQELENNALEKLSSVLSIYYGVSSAISYPEPVTRDIPQNNIEEQEIYYPEAQAEVTENYYTPPEVSQPESTTGDIRLNENQIQKYQRYADDPSIPEPIVINKDGVGDITSFEKDRIKDLWLAYQGDTTTVGVRETELLAEELYEPVPEAVAISEEEHEGAYEEEIAVVEGEVDENLIPADETVIYRVQLAADKTKLSQGMLQKLYYGNKNIEMINEGGWFKYSVGNFDTYKDADVFRKNAGLKEAFIVAYRKGTRFIPGIAAIEKEQVTAESITQTILPQELSFYVQIAASRLPLRKETLYAFYKGDYPVEVMVEDGWYKYRIGTFCLYSNAVKVRNITPVRGIFIIAYEQGIKQKLSDAINKSTRVENDLRSGRILNTLKEVYFSVQIAATKSPLSETALQKIYNGDLPVTLVIEDSWYKYQIKAGNTYEQAQLIKASSNVERSFIVAYKHGKKMELYRAIRESR
ncbi:MAG: hypothetical protein JXJ22_03870 [Bacteroidales bacterium]|nr:hypothetical protein [Bacteroidales bacterium]